MIQVYYVLVATSKITTEYLLGIITESEMFGTCYSLLRGLHECRKFYPIGRDDTVVQIYSHEYMKILPPTVCSLLA